MPAPPYLHGSKIDLQPDDRLVPGPVNDGENDDRVRVCADIEFDWALYWAKKRTPPQGTPHDGTPKVYEVHLDDPEVDTNVHRPYNAGRDHVHAVMAKSGHVIRRLYPEPENDA